MTTSNGDDVFPVLCASDGDKGFSLLPNCFVFLSNPML